jgi:hypothetical protein
MSRTRVLIAFFSDTVGRTGLDASRCEVRLSTFWALECSGRCDPQGLVIMADLYVYGACKATYLRTGWINNMKVEKS